MFGLLIPTWTNVCVLYGYIASYVRSYVVCMCVCVCVYYIYTYSYYIQYIYIYRGGSMQDFLRGGSEHRGVSLKQGVWGAQPPRSYRVFYYYNTKIMLIVRYRAYLSRYKEVFNQIWSRGCSGCNPLEGIGCFII